MNKAFLKNTVRFGIGVGLVVVASALTGCQMPTVSNDIKFTAPPADADKPLALGNADEAMRFAKDDLVIVTFSGQQDLQTHEERIKEDGTITLQFINSIKAEGKTTGELQREIHKAYVPTFYKRLT
ncbi:MAG: hypothetical protein DVB33_09660, partial [Verrucomicrobia bacterium]